MPSRSCVAVNVELRRIALPAGEAELDRPAPSRPRLQRIEPSARPAAEHLHVRERRAARRLADVRPGEWPPKVTGPVAGTRTVFFAPPTVYETSALPFASTRSAGAAAFEPTLTDAIAFGARASSDDGRDDQPGRELPQRGDRSRKRHRSCLPMVAPPPARHRPLFELSRVLELLEELLVVADVVGRVVGVRREHEQDGVARVAPLRAPDQRRDVQRDVRAREPDLVPRLRRRRRGSSREPAVQTRSCEHARWACAPRTDSLGTP